MLIGVNQLRNYSIHATDGDIGSVHDALFDDEFWVLRYLVVNTAHWLPGRKVLLTPGVLGKPDWQHHQLPVKLSRSQVKDSPDVDSDQPVSRQRETELHNYYGWPVYWGMAGATPMGIEPTLPILPPPQPPDRTTSADPHLRSVRELHGYHIQASDGELGHVDDFIVDDETWDVRYMVVATTNWLPGRKVLVSPHWLVGHISWSQHKVTVILTRDSIKNSPIYDPAAFGRRYENELHEYYGRPGYWLTENHPAKKRGKSKQ